MASKVPFHIPKPPSSKLSVIKPTKKGVGRVDDLTRRGRRDIVTGTDWGAILEEFAGASGAVSPFKIERGVKAQFSVPVDLPFEEPAKSYKVLIRGIPQWLDTTKIYYDLMVHLSRHHLLMISGLEFVEDNTPNTKAAWIVIDGTEEAARIFESKNFHIHFSVHQVFNLPRSLYLNQPELHFFAYEEH